MDSGQEMLKARMIDKFVGPPAPPVYEPRPLEGRQDEPAPASIKDMGPAALGALLDMFSTERMIGAPIAANAMYPGSPATVGEEKNPIMMGGPGQRLGLNLGELLLAHFLTKGHPNLRKAYNTYAPAMKGSLAMNNFGLAQNQDVQEMVMHGKGIK